MSDIVWFQRFVEMNAGRIRDRVKHKDTQKVNKMEIKTAFPTKAMHITDSQVEIYQMWYEDSLQETNHTDALWKEHQNAANAAAADVIPEVAEALTQVMRTRREGTPNDLNEGSVKRINTLLGWKVTMKPQYCKEGEWASGTNGSSETTPSGNLHGGKRGVYWDYGTLQPWYIKRLIKYGTVQASDSELTDLLGCHQGTFSSARTKMVAEGYTFLADRDQGGGWTIDKRPVTKEDLKAMQQELTDKQSVIEGARKTARDLFELVETIQSEIEDLTARIESA